MILGSNSITTRAPLVALIALAGTIFVLAQSEKTSVAPEPEVLGVLYYLDTAKSSLVPLERQAAKASSGILHASAEIKLERSVVRINAGAGQDFVVSLASGVDPKKFELFPMEVKKGKRRTVTASAKMFSVESGKSTIALEIKRNGSTSYKLSPAQRLPAGEYCFSPADSDEAFCFGIDPK